MKATTSSLSSKAVPVELHTKWVASRKWIKKRVALCSSRYGRRSSTRVSSVSSSDPRGTPNVRLKAGRLSDVHQDVTSDAHSLPLACTRHVLRYYGRDLGFFREEAAEHVLVGPVYHRGVSQRLPVEPVERRCRYGMFIACVSCWLVVLTHPRDGIHQLCVENDERAATLVSVSDKCIL